jgi:ABC-2 type transport system ATP-binding protein
MIKVKNVTKYFGQNKAIDDISFEINRGEVIGFLGPNGAGKTTTMRIIAGFMSPDKGSVSIDGVSVITNSIEAKKKIGYLPENNPLYKDMLVSEFLEFSADLNNISADKRKEAMDFAVSSVGIEKIFNKPIAELSKGYKQRVGIAAAIIHRPEVIIMDEPTEGLDPNQRTDMRTLIKKLAEKHTIIISTHVMQEAAAMCNRLIVIKAGKIVADGTADELSKKAQRNQVISVDIEGHEVQKLLQEIMEVDKVEIEKSESNHVVAKVYSKNDKKLQPAISKLAQQHNWIMWKISEEVGLEDIFHELTQ